MSDLINTTPASLPIDLNKGTAHLHALEGRFKNLHGRAKPTHEELRQAAQDFEGVLLGKLLDEVQRTFPEDGLLSSPTTRQLQGLFWSKLADVIAQQGGIGVAEQLYQDFCKTAHLEPQTPPSRLRVYHDENPAEPPAFMEHQR